MTRRIVMFNRISADGYFAAPDGSLDFFVTDEELDREATESMPDADTILFGRVTYQMFERHWPKARESEQGAEDPHAPGRRTERVQTMADWIHGATKLVFSRSLQSVDWQGARLMPAIDGAELRELKQQPGRDMLIFGSGSLVVQLTQLGLIDEYQLVVSPLLLGRGRNWLGELSERVALRLLEAKATRVGNVMLRYEPSRE